MCSLSVPVRQLGNYPTEKSKSIQYDFRNVELMHGWEPKHLHIRTKIKSGNLIEAEGKQKIVNMERRLHEMKSSSPCSYTWLEPAFPLE